MKRGRQLELPILSTVGGKPNEKLVNIQGEKLIPVNKNQSKGYDQSVYEQIARSYFNK